MSNNDAPLDATQPLGSRGAAARRRRAIITRRRRRKIQALLAGGLVLGVGASATVAAWTDQENATGDFQAGVFAIESNVTPNVAEGWQSNDQMQFNATNMYPGQEVYAPVSIRTSPDTTINGEVSIASSETAGGLAQHLSYQVAILDGQSSACGPSSFDPDDAAMLPLSNPPVNNDPQAISMNGRNVVEYCFHVLLDANTPNSFQGQTTEHTWVWNATSVDEG